MGIELKSPPQKEVDKNGEKSGRNRAGALTVVSELKCHFCGEGQHAVVTTSKGKKIIPYYVCEKFVALSPSERYSKLKSKNLCTTCLLPGAVKGRSISVFIRVFAVLMLTASLKKFTSCCAWNTGAMRRTNVWLKNLWTSLLKTVVKTFRNFAKICHCLVQLFKLCKKLYIFNI